MISKKQIAQLKMQYEANKKFKVGDMCKCPYCETVFMKANYQQAFCKTRGGTVCKDAYWNKVTPNKRNNQTRISPASQRWSEEMREKREISGYNEELGWDDHKDTF